MKTRTMLPLFSVVFFNFLSATPNQPRLDTGNTTSQPLHGSTITQRVLELRDLVDSRTRTKEIVSMCLVSVFFLNLPLSFEPNDTMKTLRFYATFFFSSLAGVFALPGRYQTQNIHSQDQKLAKLIRETYTTTTADSVSWKKSIKDVFGDLISNLPETKRILQLPL